MKEVVVWCGVWVEHPMSRNYKSAKKMGLTSVSNAAETVCAQIERRPVYIPWSFKSAVTWARQREEEAETVRFGVIPSVPSGSESARGAVWVGKSMAPSGLGSQWCRLGWEASFEREKAEKL
uniref:Uncharacterized protein n=1 Tax=Cannabis sativa TaxID=3483 RepID=A0A803PJR7_CANSA